MKNTLLLCLAAICLGMAEPPTPRHLVIAVGPHVPASLRADIGGRIRDALCKGAPGTRVTVLDAAAIQTVAAVTISGSPVHLQEQRNERAIRAALHTVRSATNEARGFNVPLVLDHISRQIRPQNGSILLVGPSMYRNEKSPAFNLTTNWPGDGHLTAGWRSVFSTLERTHQLERTSVHWLVTDPEGVVDEVHRRGLGRFWSLFVATQGGVLADYAPDVATAFAGALAGSITPFMTVKVDPGDTNLLFHWSGEVALRPSPRLVFETNRVQVTNVIWKTNVMAVVSNSVLPRVAPGNTGIGLVWAVANGGNGRTDLDLHVKAPRDEAELFFGHPLTASGRYLRDVLQAGGNQAGDWRASWEFVELHGDQLPEVWINLYSGSGPVNGEVRVDYRGSLHRIAFVMPAVQGDGGADGSIRARSPRWLKLDLRAALNLD
jgi:hypothetical protein